MLPLWGCPWAAMGEDAPVVCTAGAMRAPPEASLRAPHPGDSIITLRASGSSSRQPRTIASAGVHAWRACVASMRGVHAWRACVARMRGAHAWRACVVCMRGVHAWRACVACMRGVYAWRACVACMRGVHAWRACVAPLRQAAAVWAGCKMCAARLARNSYQAGALLSHRGGIEGGDLRPKKQIATHASQRSTHASVINPCNS